MSRRSRHSTRSGLPVKLAAAVVAVSCAADVAITAARSHQGRPAERRRDTTGFGADFAAGAAVAQLKRYIQAVWSRYHKPIWLTEFALIRFGATSTFPSPAQQAAFVSRAMTMLQRLPYVWRYAWFALPRSTGDGTTGLFANGAVATAAGRAFEKVDA